MDHNLSDLKKDELLKYCKQNKIKQYSNKSKQELINHIQNYSTFQTDKSNNIKTNQINYIPINLNPQQKEIVYSPLNQNIRILACAGSGKTTTLIHRIRYLIDQNINPDHILITTFNIDASNSIKQKISTLIQSKIPYIGTIDHISKRFFYKYKIDTSLNFLGVSEYSLKLLEFLKNKEISKPLLNQYKYIFFDEFQDINNVQFQILKQFYNNGSYITVIGDDAQNIYSFRNSNIDFILNLEKYFDHLTTYSLTYNYRSTKEIIDFANYSISYNNDQIKKQMIPIRKKQSTKPIIKYYSNLKQQNIEIIKIISDLHFKKNINFEDIAILSRNNYSLKILEEQIEEHNLHNPENKINYIALISNSSSDKKPKIQNQHLTLTTIHKSKGLEWKVIFLISCEDKYFPSQIDKISIQEERRLFYVAITRPKNILYISFTSNHVSRFIHEIDSNLYNFLNFNQSFFQYDHKRNQKFINSVTEIIDILNEEHLHQLRELNILQNFKINEQKLHNSHNYHENINKFYLHSDYGNFIDRYISRLIGEYNPKSQGLKDQIAEIVIAAVNLDRHHFKIYQKYKQNFIHNIHLIKPSTKSNHYLSILSSNEKKNHISPIILQDSYYIHTIITLLLETSQKYEIPIDKLLLIPKNYLPINFKDKMIQSLKNFKNHKLNSNNILLDIYHISLCASIYDQRRRLLYKNVFPIFNDNQLILENIQNNYLQKIINNKLLCKYSIHSEIHDIVGEIDLIDLTQKKIIDYKTSLQKNIDIKWILQLLTYFSLLKLKKKKISFTSIEIYNPLQGYLYNIDLTNWNKHNELLDYLSHIRNLKQK